MPIYNYGLRWKFINGDSLSGRRGISKKPVDFRLQVGLYVLYKGKSLVYVGKTGSGKFPNLHGRLDNHAKYGNKVGKWDTVSWFGFKPVVEGELMHPEPSLFEMSQEIRDVEALLISLLNPPMNGNGGSYKHIERYEQISPTS